MHCYTNDYDLSVHINFGLLKEDIFKNVRNTDTTGNFMFLEERGYTPSSAYKKIFDHLDSAMITPLPSPSQNMLHTNTVALVKSTPSDISE